MLRNALRSRLVVVVGCFALASVVAAGAAAGDDWPTYLHDQERSSASADTSISPQTAAQLTLLWRFKTGSGVAASPTVVGGVAYVGSWDGYEYALDAATGALRWKTFLGVTNAPSSCPYPQSAGVTSSAAVKNGVVYVGGGDSYWYALDASSGAVLWRVFTGDNSAAGGHYNWSSPLIYNGAAYIGIASLSDCPLVQGELLRVDISSHQVLATFKAVPDGQVGGGIWTSPAVDAATNTIYVTTGTTGAGSAPGADAAQPLSQAMVALDATTLAFKGSWQVPAADQVDDGDWGTTPTLISGGRVVATNKNGVVYAFQRSNVSAGPVWQQRIANGGACPTCGDGSVSSDAFDGSRLYVGAEKTSVGNIAYTGSISALDPATGKVLWRKGQQGNVIPALATVNGLVLAGVGSNFTVVSAATGQTLFSYATGNAVYSPPAVAGGRIFMGSQDGYLYAFGLSSSQPPPPPNTVRVNAGGASYVDSQANSWSADCCSSGGNVFATTSPIAGTNDGPLYQSERWFSGTFTYGFTGLASGSYQVTLKFAEIAWLGSGQRRFNVAINGTQVLTNFDVAAQVGQNTALDKTFAASVGSDGHLTVTFSKGAADNPIVSAIQVTPVAAGSLSFLSAPQTLTAGQPSGAMRVGVSQAPATNVSASLRSSSSSGKFATSPAGPWSSTLDVTVPAGQTASQTFYYEDTIAGTPSVTASANGYASATQAETVAGGALAAITVSPSSATVPVGGTQTFTATGADQYGNGVSASGASWTTSAPGSVSPASGSTTVFTAGSTAGTGQVVATIGAISGNANVTVATTSGAVRVNAAGGSYVDSGGHTWSADCCNSGGNTYSTISPIAGTSDPRLYQSERWSTGTFTYTLVGLASGSYQVTLKFAEIAWLGPGRRQFNVAINGTQVLTNFDVAAQVGFNTALDKTFATTVGGSGQLTIAFSRGAADNPIVSAIQVVPS